MDTASRQRLLSGPLKATAGLALPPATPDRENAAERRRWFWGIDPSTVRISVAVVDPNGEKWQVRTHSFTRHPARSLERVECIRRETDQFLRTLAHVFLPAFVLVEEPGGKWVEPQLQYAVGAILSCVPIVGPGTLVPVSTWKLHGLGHGATKKPEILRWARRKGYEGNLQDEADALGIAFACRALHSPKPEQLALAS